MSFTKRNFLRTVFVGAPALAASQSFVAPAAAAARPPAKTPVGAGTAEDQARAVIPGMSDARFPANSTPDFRAALGSAALLTRDPWLALSTGGENGAFGAGLLNGWTLAGDRPSFAVVTGISTGALIAPFAFLGPRCDAALRDAYTTINAGDVFEIGATETSLLDTWPLARLIARYVTPELLAAVAAEHAAGRRLFVLTTNLDSGQPVAWNMGVIAQKGDAAALKLFRDVLLASGSIPGLFPTVTIEVETNGRRLQETHSDGGITTPFYIAPETVIAGGEGGLPAREIYVIVNNRLDPEFLPTQRSTMSVLGNALSSAVKAATRAALKLHEGFARENGVNFRVAAIGADFATASASPFDRKLMRALYDHAQGRARSGTAFLHGASRHLAAKS